jgi:hypothetical protein
MSLPHPANMTIQVIDLGQELPKGWAQDGLSKPKSDGANAYRNLFKKDILFSFSLDQPMMMKYRYQLYSVDLGISVEVLLNGSKIDYFKFPPSKYENRQIVGFAQAGVNKLEMHVKCENIECDVKNIRQYFTQIVLSPYNPAIKDVGLGVQRWALDAPESLIHTTGTGPLIYDDDGVGRLIEKSVFTIVWPDKSKVLDASMRIISNQDVIIKFYSGNEFIRQYSGSAGLPLDIELSLINNPVAKDLKIHLACTKTPRSPCASVYFTRVSAVPAAIAAPSKTWQLGLGVILLLAALLFLWWWLRLTVHRVG